MLTKAHYAMIGGFLGAGKTTAILHIAEALERQALRVGLIANDQSIGLVDTALFESRGFAAEEISGGCFCCKFNSLVEASERLAAGIRPDVLLAEPVGSCTDLVATVSLPLMTMYGDRYRVAPLSVLVDPIRAQRMLGLRQGKAFSPKVQYIYDKQLEEAELIVVNKSDLLDETSLGELQARLDEKYVRSRVLAVSARTGAGMDDWITVLLDGEAAVGSAMNVDYDTYAQGEALLGWLNVSASLEGEPFDGDDFLVRLITGVQGRLDGRGIDVAHLKATLSPSAGNDLAAGNLVRDDSAVELSHRLAERLSAGELIVNLRAEGDPAVLEEAVGEELRSLARVFRLTVTTKHSQAFRPARPTPTHRLAAV
jgi:Ni2+-binding GTPase involved in maturation of urease and hydrogenase